jgi:frataxin-like iron-binding protein CyaY
MGVEEKKKHASLERIHMDEKAPTRRLFDDNPAPLDDAFAEIDPDLAESSISQGALTILFPGGLRASSALSPPVRQMWLAFPRPRYHFRLGSEGKRWIEDRGERRDL